MYKKKYYKKPEIKAVNLVPEEAVLTNCKATFTGPGGGSKCIEHVSLCNNRQPGT